MELAMELNELLRRECVAVDLAAADKREALDRIASLAKRSALLEAVSAEEIRDGLEQREAVGTTGFGKGIAIPHCRLDSAADFIVGVAAAPSGVDFDSIDGEPVRLIVFIVGPARESTEHIRVLSALSRVVSQADAVAEMLAAPTPEALRESFLRHTSIDRGVASDAERNLFHVFVQDESLFQDLLQVFGGTEPRFTAVIEAENASAYLARMPLFAGLWSDSPRSFSRAIVSLVQRRMTNEMIRRIEEIAGPLAETERVLVTVQSVFYSGGALTT